MDVWGTYSERLTAGNPEMDPQWDAARGRLQDRLRRKLISSLSYKQVRAGNEDIRLAVIDTANDYHTKKIFSEPGKLLPHGSYLTWNDAIWLVTEADPHHDVYQEGKMRQCNYYLKWINKNGDVVGRWCVVEDGTKYLIGERAKEMMAIGDARIAVTICKDHETSQINRGRRFLIDDMDSGSVLAYEVTKPNKLFNVYHGKGVFRFILGECNLSDNDNVERRIADYYNWSPDVKMDKPDIQTEDSLEEIVESAVNKKNEDQTSANGKKVWL